MGKPRNKSSSEVLSIKPTEEDLNSPEFRNVWNYIKNWKISVPGDMQPDDDKPSGQHVMDILIATGLRNPSDYNKL